MSYIYPVLLLCALNSLSVHVFKKEFGQVLPFTVMASVLFLYLVQYMLHSFQIGWIMLLILAGLGTALTAVYAFKKDPVSRPFFGPGSVSFLVVCGIAIVLNYGRRFSDFDEFWHWGMMVKEQLRLDRFYCIEASRMVIHKDYPPFLSILELLWVKTGGAYSEGLLSTSLHVMIYSLLVVPAAEIICSGREQKRPCLFSAGMTALLTVLLILVFSIFDHADIYYTILADFSLGAVFAFCLIQIIGEDAYRDRFGLITLILGCITLVMIKQAGLAMFFVSVLTYVFVGWGIKDFDKRSLLTGGFLLILIPLLIYASWTLYVRSVNIANIRAATAGGGQFDLGKISVPDYLNAVLKREPGLRQDTFRALISAFLYRGISHLAARVEISYVSSFALVLGSLLLINRCFPKEMPNQKALGCGISFSLGYIGYAFMLSVLFLFCFTGDEMQELRGYERYVESFVLGIWLSLMLTAVSAMAKREIIFHRIRDTAIVVLFSTVLLGSTNYSSLIPQSTKTHYYAQYDEMADFLEKTTLPDSAITVVYATGGDYGAWYGSLQSHIYYYLNDRDFLWGCDLFHADFEDDPQRQAAEEQLKHTDYLYVINTNENVNSFFSEVSNITELSESSVYRVQEDGSGRFLLTAVN